MTYTELIQIFTLGLVFGICLSAFPLFVGEVINLIFKIMKGGF